MKKTLTINRKGMITIKPEQGSQHQCVNEGHSKYRYECRVSFDNPKLDERGFLADHVEVNGWVEEFFRLRKMHSCELAVIAAAEEVMKRFQALGKTPKSVYMKLIAATFAPQSFMEIELFPDEPTEAAKVEDKESGYRIHTMDEIEELLDKGILGRRYEPEDESKTRYFLPSDPGKYVTRDEFIKYGGRALEESKYQVIMRDSYTFVHLDDAPAGVIIFPWALTKI